MWFSTAVISIYLHTALIIRIRTIVTTGLARPRIRSDSKIKDSMDIDSRLYAYCKLFLNGLGPNKRPRRDGNMYKANGP